MKQLVNLRTRSNRDDKTFTYFLDYADEQGKRKRFSLGHADKRKAEGQRAQRERELRMGIMSPSPQKLSIFVEDSLNRTGRQIRCSTQREYSLAMRCLIKAVGNINYQRISLRHAELFRQACFDQGNAPATVAKKLRHLKRLFQLAVDRKQLDENPFKRIALPKSPKRKVHIYTADECQRILKAAGEYQTSNSVRWNLLIFTALITGMRRGELLNAVWTDIDFEAKTIEVSPKKDANQTWEWHIKDTNRRLLPLTKELVSMFAEHQCLQPVNHPYVFVPPGRYDRIQKLRRRGKWIVSSRQNLVNNFTRQFKKILKRAEVKSGTFHDLRRTALSNWLANGVGEYDVMQLAGHSDFGTTHKFYLAVTDKSIDKARRACSDLARTWHAPSFIGERT